MVGLTSDLVFIRHKMSLLYLLHKSSLVTGSLAIRVLFSDWLSHNRFIMGVHHRRSLRHLCLKYGVKILNTGNFFFWVYEINS